MIRFRSLAPWVAAAWLAACSRPAGELPSIEGWAGEPQVAEAIEAARAAAAREPTASSLGRLAELFHAHELHAEAVACYRQAMEIAPTEPRWPYLAALAMRKIDLAESVPFFELAIERGAAHAALFVSFGDTLAQLDRPEEARSRYRRALEVNPASTHALYGLAQISLAVGEVEAARLHLERAARLAPWHGEVHMLLARVYQRQGREEEAQRQLLIAGAYPEATQEPDPLLQSVRARGVNSRAYLERGRRLARAGRFAEAEAQFRRVLEIRPGSAGDHSNLGGALARQGKTAEAIEQYRKSLEIEPRNPFALNNLAMAQADGGDLAAAVATLGRVLEIEPTYAEAHHNLGLIRARRGQHREAITHYRDALSNNPSSAPAHGDLGAAWAALGDLEAAIESWRRALDIDARELSALYNLSVALAGRGEHREALEWLARGLEIAPNSSRIASFYAWELATAPTEELRDGARATTLAQLVYDSYPTQPAAGDVLAAALAELGRFDDAAHIAEQAVQQAVTGGQQELADQIGDRLAGYRRGAPYRQER